MKLLFDENLAARLVGDLADIYPDSAHVSALGLGGVIGSAKLTHLGMIQALACARRSVYG